MYYSHDMKPLKLGERKLKEKKKKEIYGIVLIKMRIPMAVLEMFLTS